MIRHDRLHEVPCRCCGRWGTTIYCAICAEHARCAHGEQVGACARCDVDADRAFDAARESRR